jgi:uncharacterized protein YceK
MKIVWRAIPPSICLLLLSGCGTIYDLQRGPRVYGGFREDISEVGFGFRENQHEGIAKLMGIVAVLDTPFSLVLDTLLLPVTLTIALTATDPSPSASEGGRAPPKADR